MPSKGNEYLVGGRAGDRRAGIPTSASSSSAKASCRARSRRRRARSVSAIGSCSSASSATSPRCSRRFDIVVFPSLWEGTPLTAFEALAMGKPIVATDADGLLDILTDRHDALIVPEARCRGAGRTPSATLIEQPALAAQLAAAARADRARATTSRAFVREDGAALRAAARDARAPRGARACCRRTSSFLTASGRRTMTIDQPVATRLEGRSLAWRLGASATLALGVVLLAWALTVDFPRSPLGFFSDGATYYSLAHSLADDFDFEYRARGSRARVAGVPERARRHLPEARQRRRRLARRRVPVRHVDDAPIRIDPALLRQVVHLSAVRRAVRLAVRHQRLPGPARAADDAVLRVRLRVPGRAQPPDRGARLRVRVSCSSRSRRSTWSG